MGFNRYSFELISKVILQQLFQLCDYKFAYFCNFLQNLPWKDIYDTKQELEIPLSLCFTAFKDDEYFGKGEENLKFSGCSLNTNDIMDPR